MRAVTRVLKHVVRWLERRFPEKMTTDQVMSKFVDYERRLAMLETAVVSVKSETQKLKIFNGISQLTGMNGE